MSKLNSAMPYPWPEGKKSAFCFSVDVDAHAPWIWNNRNTKQAHYSQLEQRLYGSRLGMTRLTDLLAQFGIRATFFVPGVVAETFPWMLPQLVEAGHEVGLHGYFHELVNEVSDEEFTRVLDASVAIFEKQLGEKPKGFRSPAWEMTPHMVSEVKRYGFYDSSLMGLDTPYSFDDMTEIPVSWTTDDAIFFKFLTPMVDNWKPSATRPILEAWKDELEASRRFGSLMMLTVHDWISGRGVRIAMLEQLLELVTSQPDIWIASAGELAAYYETRTPGHNAIASDMPESLFNHPVWKDA
nr:polysaccharide deacetylase family protein [uncultured Cohaesibacter sp.]